MKPEQAVKWCGLSLLLAGVLILILMPLHPNEAADPNALASPLWGPVHLGIGFAFLLSVFGFAGVYAKQAEKAGTMGFVGAAISIAGMAVFSGVILLFEGAVVPAIASSQAGAELLAPSGPLLGGLAGQLFAAIGALTALGFIITGLATFRARVFPRWAGILLLGITLPMFMPPVPLEAGVAGAMLFGIGCIILGRALWSGKK